MSELVAPVETGKRARTRERLMDAAAEVFSENGFVGGSLEIICERAGLTRGAFYYNFSSKEELFLAVMERELDATLALVPTAMSSNSAEFADVLDMVASLYASGEHDHVGWALLSEEFRLHAMRDETAAAAYTEHFRVIHERLGATLRDAAAAHGRRMLAPPETIAAIVTGTFFQAVNEGVLARLSGDAVRDTAIGRVTVAVEALMPRR